MAEWERVTDPYDPERCQSGSNTQQCMYKATNGTKYCPRHGGVASSPTGLLQTQRWNYRLGKWQARAQEFANSPILKSLKEEIGVLRILLEETVQKCQDQYELLFASQTIVMLVDKIKDTVLVAQKLETQLGQQLSQSELFAVAEELVKIIIETVPDPRVCEQLADKIGITLTRSLAPKGTIIDDDLIGQISETNPKQIDSSSGNFAVDMGGEVQNDAGAGRITGPVELKALPMAENPS